MRFATSICMLGLWMAGTALADDAARSLSGTWTARADGKDTPTTWVFEQQGDALKVTEMNGTDKLAAFECNTMGHDCEIKDRGKKATVSMWFSGPKLVQLETKGSEIVKRRFAVDEKGDTMDVEIISISPSGKPEVLHFKRTQVAAQKQH